MNKVMVLLFGITCLAVLLVAVQPASSMPVQAEPDLFPQGTNISSSFWGVTLSTVGPRPGDGHVYSILGRISSTGTRVFGNVQDGDLWYGGIGPSLRADFTLPARSVQIDLIMLTR